jgi:cytochrome b561
MVALVALGLYMVRLPDVGFNATKIVVLLHGEVGTLVMALVAVRLAWRELSPLPRLAETLPEWQKVAAVFVHLLLRLDDLAPAHRLADVLRRPFLFLPEPLHTARFCPA